MEDKFTVIYQYNVEGDYLYTPNLNFAVSRNDNIKSIICYKYYPSGLGIDVEKSIIQIVSDEDED